MGRRPSNPGSVPRLRMRKRPGKTYYFYDHGGEPRREEPLGTDYGLAIVKWAEREKNRRAQEKVAEVVTFRYVADCYRADVIPTKGQATQKDNARELKQLLAYFDTPPCPIDSIKPKHVRQYLTKRSAVAPVRANREKALLSHIFNYAREHGFTDQANPCAGIKGNKEKGRDTYVTDDAYKALWEASGWPLRDTLDLAYLTGQRPSDVLGMTVVNISGDVIEFKQGKTNKKIRMSLSPALSDLLARIAERKSTYPIHAISLTVDERGRPLSYRQMHDRFCKARDEAKVDFQFRDLRAKAASDKADSSGDIREAQRQMGHTSVVMTEHYVRSRRGAKVDPTK